MLGIFGRANIACYAQHRRKADIEHLGAVLKRALHAHGTFCARAYAADGIYIGCAEQRAEHCAGLLAVHIARALAAYYEIRAAHGVDGAPERFGNGIAVAHIQSLALNGDEFCRTSGQGGFSHLSVFDPFAAHGKGDDLRVFVGRGGSHGSLDRIAVILADGKGDPVEIECSVGIDLYLALFRYDFKTYYYFHIITSYELLRKSLRQRDLPHRYCFAFLCSKFHAIYKKISFYSIFLYIYNLFVIIIRGKCTAIAHDCSGIVNVCSNIDNACSSDILNDSGADFARAAVSLRGFDINLSKCTNAMPTYC